MLENTLLGTKKIIHSSYLKDNILSLGDRVFMFPKEFEYRVIEVTAPFKARMDLISFQMYGTIEYSDFLCKVNGVSNPFELNEGMILVVPSITDLHKFASEDVLIEEGEEGDDRIGVKNVNEGAKKKTDKRKPNEAILGDRRYKIDSVKKVIVY